MASVSERSVLAFASGAALTAKIRRANGTLTRAANELGNDLNRSAGLLQELAAFRLRSSLKRPGESTARLERVILARGNIVQLPGQAGAFGFGIGNKSFMDSSDAKYWRQIERGYAGHVGRAIYIRPGGGIGTGDRIRSVKEGNLRGATGVVRIRRPITAHHYYRDAFADWRRTEPARLLRDFKASADSQR